MIAELSEWCADARDNSMIRLSNLYLTVPTWSIPWSSLLPSQLSLFPPSKRVRRRKLDMLYCGRLDPPDKNIQP
jgi:hypothetical protein